MQNIELSMIVLIGSARLNIYSDITIQLFFDKLSILFAKMKQITNIPASVYPIHTFLVLDRKIILKFITSIIL